MKTQSDNMTITVQTNINAPVKKVWTFWTDPEHIIHWNNASDDWHTPKAENDLRVGGRFLSRMEAKDGSMGFDFTGEYTMVDLYKRIEYNIGDGRKVQISFISVGTETIITEIFEAEKTHTTEMQQEGWQAILDNFKKYVEASGELEIQINRESVKKVEKTAFQKITPFLWFDNQAEDAAHLYTSIFKNSKITSVNRYGKEGAKVSGRLDGSVMTVAFQIEGQEFVAINGGPVFGFTPAISFVVNCETLEEVNYYWEKLSEGGDEKAQQCGWLKDKFGISWQVVPVALGEMLNDPDSDKTGRVMKSMLQMKKIDMNVLRKAYNNNVNF